MHKLRIIQVMLPQTDKDFHKKALSYGIAVSNCKGTE